MPSKEKMKRELINKIIGKMLGEIKFFCWSTQWNYADGMKHRRYSVLDKKRRRICYLHHKNDKMEIEGLKNIDHPRFKVLHKFFRSHFDRECGVNETRRLFTKDIINEYAHAIEEINKKMYVLRKNEKLNKKLIGDYIIKKFGEYEKRYH